MRIKTIEGVQYLPWRVYYVLSDGRRRKMVRWSPAPQYLRTEVARELVERFGEEGIRPGSVTFFLNA